MPNPTNLIRPVRAADQPEWERLWRSYLEFYGTELPDEMFDLTFSRLLSGGPAEPRCLVAEAPDQSGNTGQGPELAGLVHFLYHAHCWKPRPVCYLQDLFVDPRFRGLHLGRQLIERVYEQATGDGAPDVYWLTQEFNHTARRLYDRVGVLTPFIKYQRPPT